MVWKPTFDACRPEPHATYEGRVARLFRGEDEVGLLLVRGQQLAYQESGHLWWKRFAAAEPFLVVWTIVDGHIANDWLTSTDMVEAVVQDWAEGRHDYYDDVLRLDWVAQNEAERLTRSAFAHLDDAG